MHHLHNNEVASWLPVDNMKRCLRSPYLYPLLGLCRCYFPEQYPDEEIRGFITLFSIICLTQLADLEVVWGTGRPVEWLIVFILLYWVYLFNILHLWDINDERKVLKFWWFIISVSDKHSHGLNNLKTTSQQILSCK